MFLESSIPNFWEGEQTGKYIEAIARQISRVRLASDNVAQLRRTYQEIVDENTRLSTAVDDVVSNIDKQVDRAIDVAGTAAKFII